MGQAELHEQPGLAEPLQRGSAGARDTLCMSFTRKVAFRQSSIVVGGADEPVEIGLKGRVGLHHGAPPPAGYPSFAPPPNATVARLQTRRWRARPLAAAHAPAAPHLCRQAPRRLVTRRPPAARGALAGRLPSGRRRGALLPHGRLPHPAAAAGPPLVARRPPHRLVGRRAAAGGGLAAPPRDGVRHRLGAAPPASRRRR